MKFLKQFFAEFGNQIFKYRTINLFDLLFLLVWVKAFVPVLDSFGWSYWVTIPIAASILVLHHYNSWYGHKFFAKE